MVGANPKPLTLLVLGMLLDFLQGMVQFARAFMFRVQGVGSMDGRLLL